MAELTLDEILGTHKGKNGNKPRRGRGRPPFEPTEDDRWRVRVMASMGYELDQMRKLVRNPTTGRALNMKTFSKHFKHDYRGAKPHVDAAVATSLVRRALDLTHPQGASCAIFYSKVRMGWKETTTHEHTGMAGVLVVPADAAVDDWVNVQEQLNAHRDTPGANGNGKVSSNGNGHEVKRA